MIHQYKLYGLNIVLDICSGSVHIVDDVAYDIIERFKNETKEQIISGLKDKYTENADIKTSDIEECYRQVQSLIDSGRLFSEDTFEPMAGKLKEKSAGVIKALCLHVAHTCNLNCSYCFASQGKYHGERAVMSL